MPFLVVLQRASAVHSEGRQQLLREQGILDLLARLTSEANAVHQMDYQGMEQSEPNIFLICRLANALVKHALRDNIPNCLYFQKYISFFQAQIGCGTDAVEVLLALHKDNKELLDKLARDSFKTWTVLMEDAMKSGRIEGRIASSTNFLSYTCVANVNRKEVSIRDNQSAILEYLFQPQIAEPSERKTANCLVCNFTGTGGSIQVKDVFTSDGHGHGHAEKEPVEGEPVKEASTGRWVDLKDLFSPDLDTAMSVLPKESRKIGILREIQEYIIGSINLYSNICAGRNNESIAAITIKFPKDVVLSMIMEERKGCERLRAAFCGLFVRLYVDCGDRTDASPVRLTRVWDDVDESKIDTLVPMDEEPFVALKAWVVRFLSEKITTEMVCDLASMSHNTMVVAVIKMAFRMLQFHCYCRQESLKELLTPLLRILDGTTDNLGQDGDMSVEELRPGNKWRFDATPANSIVMEAKDWSLKVLNLLSLIRQNVRTSHLLWLYKQDYMGLNSGEQYIRGGSRFLGCESKWKDGISSAKVLTSIFEILNFNDYTPRNKNGQLTLEEILLDLSMYQSQDLASNAFDQLTSQYKQRGSVADNLRKVQLLCSKPQVAFFEKGEYLKNQLAAFLETEMTERTMVNMNRTLDNMILSVTPGAVDGSTTLDQKIVTDRQILYKNIGVPQSLLQILRGQSKFTTDDIDAKSTLGKMFAKVYEFLRLACIGYNETKDVLKKLGFQTFIAHCTYQWKADQLITVLFLDNRTLCTQITNDDIKMFVKLIVNHGRSPRWLNFMNSLVVVKDLPIKRNQSAVIEELVANRSKTLNSTGASPSLYRDVETWTKCRALMRARDHEVNPPTPGGLSYHVELVMLLCKCAQGKNRKAEEICQKELPLDAIIRGLVDKGDGDGDEAAAPAIEDNDAKTPFRNPATLGSIPYVKKAYLNFLWESYVELERPELKTQFDLQIWTALERMADELEQSIDLQYDLNDFAPPNSLEEKDKKDQIQYLYSDVVTFLDGWFHCYHEPEKWTSVDSAEKQRLFDISIRLLDGLCKLNHPQFPPQPECEITTQHKEKLLICIFKMERAGAGKWEATDKMAAKHAAKGKELLDQLLDKFAEGAPPQTNAALTQLGLGMFAKDFQVVCNKKEELVPLVRSLRKLLLLGNKKLKPFGDFESSQGRPEVYIQQIVTEIESPTCDRIVKYELIDILRHFVSKMDEDDELIEWKTAVSETEDGRRDELREMMCLKLGVCHLAISMIMGVKDSKDHVCFHKVIQLTIELLGSGSKGVQDVVLAILQDTGPQSKTEEFFAELEQRMVTAKEECKSAKNFYKQLEDQAQAQKELEELEALGFVSTTQETVKEIMKLTAADEEVFEGTAYVRDILLLMQQLCEGNNQAFKDFLALQVGSRKNHNLVTAAINFLAKWVSCLDQYNVEDGIQLFDTLTEVVIGPCERNQTEIGNELKLETINALLANKSETVLPMYLRGLKSSCVTLLQAMLENQKANGRVLTKFEDLNEKQLTDMIIDLWKERDGANTFVNRLKNMTSSKPQWDHGCYSDLSEYLTNLEDLAFQYATLVRQIYDIRQSDNKRPDPFLTRLLQEYEPVATRGEEAVAQKGKYNEAVQIFSFIDARMGRIEIKRENELSNGNVDSRLERVYFRYPEYCFLLTDQSKENLKADIERGSHEEKLKEFIGHWGYNLQAEMALQSQLAKYAVYRFFNTYRDVWKACSFYLAIFINFVLICGVDHEDKFYVDPGAQPKPKVYNVFDLYQADIQKWDALTVCEGIQCDNKVAYIPNYLNMAIYILGIGQTSLSSINWVLYMISYGPLTIRSGWKKIHVDAQAAKKLKDPNYEKIPFEYGKLGKGIFGRLSFGLGSVGMILQNVYVVYQSVYIMFTLLGNFVSIFFYSFHLIDILMRDQELKSVLDAIIIPFSKIAKTILLSCIVMYIFTIVGFVFFHDQFNPGDTKDNNLCNSVAQCFIFTVYYGMITNEVWAETGIDALWPRHKYGVEHDVKNEWLPMFTFRLIYDMLFFILIGVVLIGGVLFGIILDNFTMIRDEKAQKADAQENTCFVCDLGREEFDQRGAGFYIHTGVGGGGGDHNMWQYLFFIIYLKTLDPTAYNGSENYVASMVVGKADPVIKWMPNKASLVLDSADERSEDDQQADEVTATVDGLKSDLTSMKREYEIIGGTVNELKKKLKGLEEHD